MKNTYFEEETVRKVYDRTLMKRLFKYLVPYKKQFGIALILLLIVAISSTAVPYLMKYGIDNFINPSLKILNLSEYPEVLKSFSGKYSELAQEIAGKRILIKSYNIDKLPPSEFHMLKTKKVIKTDFYAKFPKNEKNTKIAEKYPDKFESFGKYYIIPQKDMTGISLEDMKELRIKDIQGLMKLALIFLIIIIMRFALNYLQIYLNQWASMHSMYDLRIKVFRHMQQLPMSYFDKNPVGRLVTRVTNDLQVLSQMLGEGLITIIQDFVMMGAIIIIMLLINYKLALITFLVLPLVYFFLMKFKKYIRLVYREVRIKLAKINTKLSENISGMETIQLFHQEKEKYDEFKQTTLEYYFAELKQLKVFAIFRPFIDVLVYLSIALIIWYGSGQIMADMMSLGVLVAFISYVRRFFDPLYDLSQKYNVVQSAMAALERIFSVLDTETEDYLSEKISNEKIKGGIEYKNVWMAYKDDEYVLKNINLKISQGESVAIVGETGGGKTTLAKLLSRYYPYQKGNIFIGGNHLEDYNLQTLRKNIGVVQQDVFIFSDRIRDNISLFGENISIEKIKEAAKFVNAEGFINKLTNKYDEIVKERGSSLSAGERQLLAFARILVSDPSIFVLDEATANIDTETEMLIQDAVQKVMKNRTSIIIAHRLSTIQHVDRIIVVHKGEIVEEGSHQELLKKRGIYYNLYRLQYQEEVK
ncbi:MAG: ABC transporter ATP-binding protein [Candidatus Cloacimonadota bacterium]|nr:ABC transporter ATP-binding protein [Candidatus Cloacimonadota bacterium]